VPPPDVRLSDLGEVRPVADGGHGVVCLLPRPGDLLLKLYHDDVAVNADELGVLIDLPARFTPADRRLLGCSTAWPRRRVFDRDRCVGLLMRRAPSRFATPLAGSSRLLELQFLLYPKRVMWQELVLPSADERRRLAVRYVRLFQVLHGNGVLFGDVSMRNLLWSLSGGPDVFALDCDGFRVLGRRPAVHPADTVGWSDPTARPGEATLETDRYKLALVVLRLLLADHAVVPGDELCQRLDRPLAVLAERAVPAGARPSAAEWLAVLAGGAGLVQRESVSRAHARGVGS
jgi:DNA-binding helix-hairpin-helix protein with protein kinase domain